MEETERRMKGGREKNEQKKERRNRGEGVKVVERKM